MNILVIGCDQVGAALIRDLERIGHDISVVEKDPEQLKRLDAFDDYTFHGTALVGDPTDPDTLRRGGVENCDAVAAVTEEDSVNLMAAQLAKNIFRRDKVICRVSDPHLQILYHKAYELETICPTVLTEQAVFRALSKQEAVFRMKASPGRGKLSPQVTDEGAGQRHFALNTPHPALRATFPPRGEGFRFGSSCKN